MKRWKAEMTGWVWLFLMFGSYLLVGYAFAAITEVRLRYMAAEERHSSDIVRQELDKERERVAQVQNICPWFNEMSEKILNAEIEYDPKRKTVKRGA